MRWVLSEFWGMRRREGLGAEGIPIKGTARVKARIVLEKQVLRLQFTNEKNCGSAWMIKEGALEAPDS